MKLFAIILLTLTVVPCLAQELPDTPLVSQTKSNTVETRTQRYIRYEIILDTAAARAADWASTQQCLRTDGCHEAILPNALAHSKVGLALFETGMVGVQWWASNRLARRHPKWAMFADAAQFVAISATVNNNYRIINKMRDRM